MEINLFYLCVATYFLAGWIICDQCVKSANWGLTQKVTVIVFWAPAIFSLLFLKFFSFIVERSDKNSP